MQMRGINLRKTNRLQIGLPRVPPGTHSEFLQYSLNQPKRSMSSATNRCTTQFFLQIAELFRPTIGWSETANLVLFQPTRTVAAHDEHGSIWNGQVLMKTVQHEISMYPDAVHRPKHVSRILNQPNAVPRAKIARSNCRDGSTEIVC